MWFLVWLCLGFVAGVLALIVLQIWWFFTPGGRNANGIPPVPMQFGAQFLPFRIPYELKQLLLSPGCEDKLKKKETCICLNLFVQFLYQEFRDSKWFRRWIVKRLQMEFNDLLSRTAVSKLLQDVKIRNFSVGTQFPVIKDIQVNRVTLAPDKDSFQDLDLILDVEYRGGFEVAIDVVALLGRRGSLSVKVTRVSGQARLQMTRVPYSHWSFAFLHDPIMEFKVDSEFRGRPLPQLVPLIINQFRRTVRKKHVLPAYKVRYRPFFINPFLQPSADPSEYTHVEPKGVVRVTVVKCTRLNLTAMVPASKLHSGELYCHISAGPRPFNFGHKRRDDSGHNGLKAGLGSAGGSESYVSIAVRYVRRSGLEPFGLTLGREYVPEKVSKVTVVASVTEGSTADRAGFKKGDLVIAVNSIGITTEKQAAKLMSNTVGDIVVLVERKLTNIENEDDVSEQITNALGDQSNPNLKVEFNTGDEFCHVSYNDEDENGSIQNHVKEESDELMLERSHSDVDFGAVDAQDALIMENINTDDIPIDPDSLDMKKVKSASVLIPESVRKHPGASSESGGSYSPGTSLAAVPDPNYDSDQRDLKHRSKKDKDDVDSCESSATASPPLSRKQRIAAKATEKVAQVAHKWTTGKATMKDMWDRRQRRKGHGSIPGEGESTSHMESEVSSMTNSKSEEEQLKHKISEGAGISVSLLSPESISGKQRNRSHSEPDTSILTGGVKEKKEKEENKSETSETSSKKTNESMSPQQATQTSTEPKKSTPMFVFQSETKPVPCGGVEPVWYQNFPVPLDDRSRYLNIVVYWRDSSAKSTALDTADNQMQTLGERNAAGVAVEPSTGPSSKNKSKDQNIADPIALGYATVFIPEILDDCSITKSLCHQQTYSLRPPSVAVKLIPTFEKMMLHPGFDPRLCYGDVTLGFHWLPDYEYSEESLGGDEQQQHIADVGKRADKQTDADSDGGGKRGGKKNAEAVPEYIVADGHKWASTHFQHSIVCHICHKKVWLKSAYKCVHCDTVSHKKCIARAGAVIGQCGQVHETVAFESLTVNADGKTVPNDENFPDGMEHTDQHETVSITEYAADAVECISSGGEHETEEKAGWSSHGKKSSGLALSERLAGLRRRRQKGETASTALANIGAAHAAVPTSLESLSNVKWGSSDDNSPFHSLLYTKGGTYNEHMILAAKDLGKDLYTSLPVDERKAKINEQIDRLQAEIDDATDRRLELLKKQGTKGEKGQVPADLAKLDDKLQALAILMLHYCAGLQCCLDLEDNATNEETSQQEFPATDTNANSSVQLEVDVSGGNTVEEKLDDTPLDSTETTNTGKKNVHESSEPIFSMDEETATKESNISVE